MVRNILPLLLLPTLAATVPATQPLAPNPRDPAVARAAAEDRLKKEPIDYQLDVPYAADDNPRHRLDVLVPQTRAADKLPVIVFIHGGAWRVGHKTSGIHQLIPFVNTGKFAGVSVGYRMSTESIWPAQLEDCKAAIRWIRANADKHHFDPDRIAVWGTSAGGHLALMVGVTGDEPESDGNVGPHKDASAKVSCVVNFFGPTDFLAEIGQPTSIDRTRPNAPEAALIGGPLQQNQAKANAASPVHHVTAGDPPVLTVHGTDDMSVPYDQAIRIDKALTKAGVKSYFVTVKGGGHGGFGNAPNERVMAFFGKYLLGKDAEISVAPIQQPATRSDSATRGSR